MTGRSLGTLATCLVAAFATAVALGVPLMGQTYAPPRTTWGDPDLQGMWPGNMGVPMQRPVELGERTSLTDAEFARRQARADEQAEADAEPLVRPGGGGIGGPSHWVERGRPTRQTSLIVDPPNGRLPDLRPDAVTRRNEARGGRGLPGAWQGEADSFEDLNIYYRCVTRGVLGSVIPVIYGNGNEIIQAPGYVALRHEMIHEARVIPLDGQPHPDAAIRMYMGDSRGRWDGDTLVVETTNLTDRVAIGSNGAGYPGDPGYHSQAVRLTERFTRTAEDTLEYEATVDDPQTWTRPWTLRIALMRSDLPHLHEYACHEGNYAMRNILSAARAAGSAAPSN